MTFCFAGINVRAGFGHSQLYQLCHDYVTTAAPDISITVTEDGIRSERELSSRPDGFSDAYYEGLRFYREFCSAALSYNVLLMHASAIGIDGRAYVYAAPSGMGKSTHTQLCREVYGSRAVMINDDKPLLRLSDGVWTVYGTPWNGRHRLGANISAPLGGICFLRRGGENRVDRLPAEDAAENLLSQVYRPPDRDGMLKTLELTRELEKEPLWELYCNMEPSAAELSVGAMSAAPTKGK